MCRVASMAKAAWNPEEGGHNLQPASGLEISDESPELDFLEQNLYR